LLLATFGLFSSTGVAQAATARGELRERSVLCLAGDFYSGRIERLDLRTANPDEWFRCK
jgi:hypothetical protein